MILRLSTRARHNSLFIYSPTNKVTSKENITTSDRVTCENISSPINNRIDNKIKTRVTMKGEVMKQRAFNILKNMLDYTYLYA